MAEAKNRLQALDALRGLAAFGVVLFHFLPYYHELYGHSFTPPGVLEFGRYGVHLFFMLSGFVIFMTLERTRHAAAFGLARAFRLLPALWFAIIITFFSVHAIGPDDRAVSAGTALFNFTLLHSFFGHEHVDGAYWSLVIEATFYFWMALLFYTVSSWRNMLRIFYLWVFISYVAVIQQDMLSPALTFIAYDLFFVRYAPLFIGGILMYQWYKHGHLSTAEILLLALSICHALVAYPAPFNMFVVTSYGIFMLAISGKLNFLANKITLWLGSLSYSLYLVHQNIGYGIISQGYQAGWSGEASVALAILAAFLLAMLIHYTVEKPALKWFKTRQQRKTALLAATR